MPFLLARIAEDHTAIDHVVAFLRSLPPKSPDTQRDPGINFLDGSLPPDHPQAFRWVPMVYEETETYTCRYDPDRSRWEAIARAEIADLHRETEGHVCGTCIQVVDRRPVALPYPCPTLRALTWPYRDHSEYDAAWDDYLDDRK